MADPLATLTPDELVALVTLVEAGGPVDLDYLGVELRLHQPHGAHPHRVASELERRGLISRMPDGRLRVPPAMLAELTLRTQAARRVTDQDVARQERPSGDFHRALMLVRLDAEPPRRRKGRPVSEIPLFKADLERLSELFGDALGGAPGVELVLRSLIGLRLLREKDELLVVHGARARAWAALSSGDRALLELSDTFCHRPYLGHVLDRLIAEPVPDGEVARSGGGGSGWVSQAALAGHYRRLRFREVGQWSPPSAQFLAEDFGEVERRLQQSPLVVVGQLRAGGVAYRLSPEAQQAIADLRARTLAAGPPDELAAAEPGARPTARASARPAPRVAAGPPAPANPAAASPERSGCCHVQPSFEVIAPPEVPLLDLLDLGRVAELLKVQTVATFRITADRVKASAARGASGPELLEIVRRLARHQVPPAVEHEVHGWAGGGARVEFVEAFLLRVAPDRADELRADKRLQPFLLAELGPGLFAVDPARRQAISRALAGHGLRPQPTVVRFPAEEDSSPAEEGQLAQELAWAAHLLGWRAAGGQPGSGPPPPAPAAAR